MRMQEPRVVTHLGVLDPKRMTDVLSQMAAQLNALSEGRIGATNNAQATVPTTGVYQVGDFVRNLTPIESGVAASKYVILGWVCVTAPLTFVPCRSATGN